MGTPSASLRILHLASWYPSSAHGTLGNFVQRHVEAVGDFTSSEVWYVAQGEAHSTVHHQRGVTERIAYARPSKWLPWSVVVTRMLLRMSRSAEVPDAIHLHVAYPAGLAARILSKRWNVPLVLTEHWTVYHADQRKKLTWWRKLAMRWTGKAIHEMCPVTAQLGHSMTDFGLSAPITVVPNVVDTELFKPGTKLPGPVLLHISSLVDEQKNVTGLIRAFARVVDRLPSGTKLHIVGDGDPMPHARLVESLGLSDRILTHGEVSLAEVAKRMAEATAVLLFSRFENFPCVIPEAWSTGTPVLATDVGGIREHLPADGLDFRGKCVPSEDENALGAAIIQLLNEPVDGERLRKYATDHFSIQSVGNAYLEVYQSLLRHD